VEERSIPLISHNGLFRLDGKTTVVTGGSSGIGRAIAETFAKNGASVKIVDLDIDRALEVTAQIRQNGGSAEAHECDVSDHSEVQRVFRDILKASFIDVLVNNAGIAHIGNLENTSETDFDRVYRVNVKGVFNCLAATLPSMKARGRGVILNMASIASSAGLPDRFAYSMSKGAVLSMTYSVARDYIAYNIRCNSISPARVFTPFVAGFVEQNYPGREKEMMERLSHAQPIGRMAEPREVASLALYLCSDEAAFITGVDYPIDGGFFNIR
jgi:NAD(P)-dependent dehydrogenase (short-subunit alcohol dehydrogenase family)